MIDLLSGTGATDILPGLADGKIWVGDGSNTAVARTPGTDVSMTDLAAFTVIAIQNKSIATTAPTNGQVLQYNTGTNKWTPATLAAVLPALTDGKIWVGNGSNVATAQIPAGDVTMTDLGQFDVRAIQTIPVQNVLPGGGQALVFNSGTGRWEPTTLTPTLPALTDGKIWVGNGSNVATAVTPAGNLLMSNTGVFRITNFNITSTNVSGATTTLNAASSLIQKFIGTGTQTLQLPDATTLLNGWTYLIENGASGTLTVNDSASGLVYSVPANSSILITLGSNATATGNWDMPSWANYLRPAVTNGGTGATTAAGARTNLNTFSSIMISIGNNNPGASTTYYFGNAGTSPGLSATPQLNQMIMPYARTLIGASVMTYVNGTLGSAGNETISLLINNTTNVVLSSTHVETAAQNLQAVTGLSQALAANDLYEFKLITPAWLTNPTLVRYTMILYFQ